MKKQKITLIHLAFTLFTLLLILVSTLFFFLNKIIATQKIYSEFLFFSPVFLILFSCICLAILFMIYLGFKNLFIPLKELSFFALAMSGGQRTYMKKNNYLIEELNTLQNAMQHMQDQIQQRELALFESLNGEKKRKKIYLFIKINWKKKYNIVQLNLILLKIKP